MPISAIERALLCEYPFDEKLTNVEDWYWASEAIARGEAIAYEPSAAVFHHHGLHQHEDGVGSFRAEPVSQLLMDAYKLEKHVEPFFNFKNWEGLTVCSKVNKRALSQLMDNFPTQYFILNDCTDHINDNNQIMNMKSRSGSDFYNFLQEALNTAEEKFQRVFDYVIFADFDYPSLDLTLGMINAKKLFNSWAELASAGRLITGKQLDHVHSGTAYASELFPTKANQASQVELTIGQCGALRSTVLRRERPQKLKYVITSILDRQVALKVSK